MARGAWRATLHGVTKGHTRLSDWAQRHTSSHGTRVKMCCVQGDMGLGLQRVGHGWVITHPTYSLEDLKMRFAVKTDLHPTPTPLNAPGHPLNLELNLNPWKPSVVQGGSLDAKWRRPMSIQRPLILASRDHRKSSDGWFRRLIRRHILVGKYNESYYKILLTVTVLREL